MAERWQDGALGVAVAGAFAGVCKAVAAFRTRRAELDEQRLESDAEAAAELRDELRQEVRDLREEVRTLRREIEQSEERHRESLRQNEILREQLAASRALVEREQRTAAEREARSEREIGRLRVELDAMRGTRLQGEGI